MEYNCQHLNFFKRFTSHYTELNSISQKFFLLDIDIANIRSVCLYEPRAPNSLRSVTTQISISGVYCTNIHSVGKLGLDLRVCFQYWVYPQQYIVYAVYCACTRENPLIFIQLYTPASTWTQHPHADRRQTQGATVTSLFTYLSHWVFIFSIS